MSSLKNDRFIKALLKQPVDMTPVWVMRQAGRYLPEYRATRERAKSFMTLCKTPELACEVTLQPLQRYALDASIIFSDILTIPDAMGLGLHFVEGQGPRFATPLRNEQQIKQLTVPDLNELNYVYEAIRLVKQALNQRVPLIGFSGSPWTVAAYMVEGQSSPGFPTIMKMRAENPSLLHHLLNVLADAIAQHLNGQIEAGADAVMIFDTWGGLLDSPHYLTFSLSYIKHILGKLSRNYNNRRIPVILFTKNGHRWLQEMANTGCEGVGIDWAITLKEARMQVGEKVALQGNMNPAILLASPETIRQEVQTLLASYGHGSGHVFNLGHGITPDVPPENMQVLVEAVHEFSKPYHQ